MQDANGRNLILDRKIRVALKNGDGKRTFVTEIFQVGDLLPGMRKNKNLAILKSYRRKYYMH